MSFDDIILPAHANPIVLEWLKTGKAKIVDSGCWEWQKGLTGDGYGNAKHNGNKMAHRIAINAPKGLCSLHSCDNPPCCNPWHLRVGTNEDNAQDKRDRHTPKGVNWEGAEELRSLQEAAGLTNNAAAELLGVCLRTINAWRAGTRNISPAMAELIKIKMGRKK